MPGIAKVKDMSGNVKIVCFLLLIPFFAAIGHDLYLAYFDDPAKVAKIEALQIDPKDYQVSDAGYLLKEYAPGFYDSARQSIGEETWLRYIDPVLQQYTFVVALVPAVLFYLYLLFAFVLGLPPFATGKYNKGKAPNMDGYERRNTETTFKYKRK